MRAIGRGLVGLALAVAAPLLYLLWGAKIVAFGEMTWPWWGALGAGVFVTAHTVVKPPEGTTTGSRVVVAGCLALAIVAAGAFAYYLRGMSFGLPKPAWDKLELGRELPDVTLAAIDGAPFNLRNEAREGVLAKKKILLSFFRGHW